jgi:nucleoid-associated protein YgaU
MSTYGAAAAWRATDLSTDCGVRLTRRGRLARSTALAVLLGVLALSMLDSLWSGPALADDSPSPLAVSTQRVTVEQGDSLWLIAGRAAPESDPRDMVMAIRELNGMRSNLIHPGEVLRIPAAR